MALPPNDRFDDDDDLRFDDPSASYGGYSGPSTPNQGTNYGHTSYSSGGFDEVQHKQREAQRLREELQRTEREAEHLGMLQEKEERFRSGRHSCIEHLKKSTLKIDHEMQRIQTVYEELNSARELFQSYLADLDSIHRESWEPALIEERLNDAIESIESAEASHQKVIRRVNHLIGEKNDNKLLNSKEFSEPSEFGKHVRMGFAFTLPLICSLLGIIILIRILF